MSSLLYAIDSLTVTSYGAGRGHGRRLEIDSGSLTPAQLGPADAIELASLLVRWAAEEMAHRKLRGIPVVGPQHHFPETLTSEEERGYDSAVPHNAP